MAIRISDKHDTMLQNRLSGLGLSSANTDNLLQQVKTFLDANFSMFKDSNGDYSVPHVNQAVLTIVSRGK